MPVTCRSSFQNSRVRPRPATASARTFIVNVLAKGPGPVFVTTLVAPAAANRTYLTIRNESLGVDIRYAYTAAELTSGLGGFLVRFGESVDIEAPNTVYAWAENAALNVQISCDEGSG